MEAIIYHKQLVRKVRTHKQGTSGNGKRKKDTTLLCDAKKRTLRSTGNRIRTVQGKKNNTRNNKRHHK